MSTPAILLSSLERIYNKAIFELNTVVATTKLAYDDYEVGLDVKWRNLHLLKNHYTNVLHGIVPLIERVPMSYRAHPTYKECVRLSFTLRSKALEAEQLYEDLAISLSHNG